MTALTNKSDIQKQLGFIFRGIVLNLVNLTNIGFNLLHDSSVSNGFIHLYFTFASIST